MNRPSQQTEEVFAGSLQICPHGIVHLEYGPVTLHFTTLEFLKLMAKGQEVAERIRRVMGGQRAGVVH